MDEISVRIGRISNPWCFCDAVSVQVGGVGLEKRVLELKLEFASAMTKPSPKFGELEFTTFPAPIPSLLFPNLFLLSRNNIIVMRDRVAQDKKYHCEICGRNFARLEHLKRHTTTRKVQRQTQNIPADL